MFFNGVFIPNHVFLNLTKYCCCLNLFLLPKPNHVFCCLNLIKYFVTKPTKIQIFFQETEKPKNNWIEVN